MNRSKKDVGRIIKQALLGSEKPTIKGVCFVVFFHALMVALIVIGVFSRNPLVQFMGMGGGFWFVSIVRGLVIELTDNSDRYIWQVVNQVLRLAVSPTKRDKLIGIITTVVAGLICIVFLTIALASGVLWLLSVALWGPIVVLFTFTIWHIWTIARQVKARRQQEGTA